MVDEIKLLDPRQAIVTWVDILGYRAMLKDQKYSKAHQASRQLANFNANDNSAPSGDWETYRGTFPISDAVIRVVDAQAPHAKGALFCELFDMAINQLNAVLNGVVVSGGMCLGEVCLGSADHRTPMGEAVGRAYELDESRWEPAICVDTNLISAFCSDVSFHQHAQKEELDYTLPWLFIHEQHHFVNYLRAATQDQGELHDALEGHRRIIIENYNDKNLPARARAKYRFMRDYHNAFINWLLSDDGAPDRTNGYAFAESDTDIPSTLSKLRIETDTHDHAIRFWHKDTRGYVTYLADGQPAVPHITTNKKI